MSNKIQNNSRITIDQVIDAVKKIINKQESDKDDATNILFAPQKINIDNKKINFDKTEKINFLNDYENKLKIERVGIDYENEHNLSFYSSICYYIADNYCKMTLEDRHVYVDRLIAKLVKDLNKRNNDILVYNKIIGSQENDIKHIKNRLKDYMLKYDYNNDFIKYVSNYFEQNFIILNYDDKTIDVFTNIQNISNHNINYKINEHRNNVILYRFKTNCAQNKLNSNNNIFQINDKIKHNNQNTNNVVFYEPVLLDGEKIFSIDKIMFIFDNNVPINIIYSECKENNFDKVHTACEANLFSEKNALCKQQNKKNLEESKDSNKINNELVLNNESETKQNKYDKDKDKDKDEDKDRDRDKQEKIALKLDEKMKYDELAKIAKVNGISLHDGKKKKTKLTLINELQSKIK